MVELCFVKVELWSNYVLVMSNIGRIMVELWSNYGVLLSTDGRIMVCQCRILVELWLKCGVLRSKYGRRMVSGEDSSTIIRPYQQKRRS